MNFGLAYAINHIRSMPDAECEGYLRTILESLPSERLNRAIQVAQEMQAKRTAIKAAKPEPSFTIARF